MIRSTLMITMMALALVASPAYAASTHGPVTVSAAVTSVLDLDVTIFDGTPAGGQTVTAMNFGTLADKGDGTLHSTKFFSVLLGANSSSRAYIIRQTGTDLTFGSNTLADGSQIFEPNNNGTAIPQGATLAGAQTWIGVDKAIYTSETAGSARTVQAVYALGGDNRTEIIPLDQTGGNYAGSVSFSLVLAS